VFTWLLHLRSTPPRTGTVMAIFCAYYGVTRFLSDSLRVNDERVLGLTGAQYLCLALLPTSAWIWFRVRRLLAEDEAAGMPVGITTDTPEGEPADEPHEDADHPS
jgi:prolipoprotein diacylglyceryltransferase